MKKVILEKATDKYYDNADSVSHSRDKNFVTLSKAVYYPHKSEGLYVLVGVAETDGEFSVRTTINKCSAAELWSLCCQWGKEIIIDDGVSEIKSMNQVQFRELYVPKTLKLKDGDKQAVKFYNASKEPDFVFEHEYGSNYKEEEWWYSTKKGYVKVTLIVE